MEIEAQAKRRLADEYDAAQQRGEVRTQGDGRPVSVPDENTSATVSDLGLTRKQVHEARQIRNAEAVSPGIVRRTLDQQLAQGKEPTKAAVREAAVLTIRAPCHSSSRAHQASLCHRTEAATKGAAPMHAFILATFALVGASAVVSTILTLVTAIA